MTTPPFSFHDNRFIGALALERVFPKTLRKILNRAFSFVIVVASIPFLYNALADMATVRLPAINQTLALPHLPFFLPQNLVLAILAIAVSLRLGVLALDSFENAKTADKNGEGDEANMARRLNWYAAELWFKTVAVLSGMPTVDRILSSFLKTAAGRNILIRLGIANRGDYETVIAAVAGMPDEQARGEILLEWLANQLNDPNGIGLGHILIGLMETTPAIREFFVARGCTKEMITETAEWVEREFTKADDRRRWWRREWLGRVPGFAKGWAYGQSIFLERFTRDISREARFARELTGREREIRFLESALLKGANANVLIIGEPGAGKHTVLLGLVAEILRGEVFPALEHKQVLELSGPTIVAAGKTKGEVESLLIRVLNEIAHIGNVVLVINEFPEFVSSLASLGVNAAEILNPYLEGSALHVLALAETASFRKILEENTAILKHFERIDLAEPDASELLSILEETVPLVEARTRGRVIITFPALQKIAEGSQNYLVAGVLPKRAVDFLLEIAENAVAKKTAVVTPEMVSELLTLKTKMPLGKIKTDEQQKLLALESLLGMRVIGQDAAVRTVADAIRRARAEIRNPKRPIGTFLFLGPTGVGKTETAKALAAVYFGNEEAMVRLDMTEFQTDDAMPRLIGSFESNEPGILPSRMRQSPYSVLLLDEFEKSSPKVKNLFLQILDEGFFSDASGTRINMRNTIIIATSNAGAVLIAERVLARAPEDALRQELMSHIQKEKIMTPELLNRFDSIIVFHPLNPETLKKIAELQLERLALRLKGKNLFLKVTEPLVDAVARGGFDPAFGARPMQRFIQDKIEKIIADKIIRREITPGMSFALGPEDIGMTR